MPETDWMVAVAQARQECGNQVGYELFRTVMASFPTGVAVVTTLDVGGSPRGMTLNALTSVSAQPPLLLICVASGSGTLAAIRRTGAFAVNFLAADGEHISGTLASPGTVWLDGLAWTPSSSALGVPVLIDHVVASAECLVERTSAAGDHHLVLGRIVGGAATDAAPLIYHRRCYVRSLTSSRRAS
jgi:flavin-dependent trigonelline monooxygenase, reductase component